MGNLINMNRKIILEKPSATISISDSLTSLQRKFYNALLYNAKEELKDNPSKNIFSIPLSSLKKFFEIDDKKNTYIKERLKELMKIIVEYNLLEKDKKEWEAFVLLPSIAIRSENNINIIKYEIPTIVKNAILKKEQGIFAKIDLIVIKGLKSKYSVILYELLKDYENVEIPEMTIKKFRQIFGVENKYKLFQDLKKRVIDVAVNEINKNPNINFEIFYVLKKEGPKYTKIKFIKKHKSKIKKIQQKQAEIKENAKLKALLGLIPEQYRINGLKKFLLEAIEKYPFKYIESQIQLVNSREGIKDYIAFLKSAIKEDYANYEQKQKELKEYSEKIKKYIKIAEKIKKEKNKKEDIKEIVRDIIFAEFNLERITEEEKNKLLDVLEQIELN